LQLYRNNGIGKFTDVSLQRGLMESALMYTIRKSGQGREFGF